jgi:hypothetical protein
MNTTVAAYHRSLRPGLTLIELVIAMVVGIVISLTVGVVLVAGQRNWIDTFNDVHSAVKTDAFTTMVTFGSTGRKSNKKDYRVYKVGNHTFIRATPPAATPVSEVTGEAIEFRYWDTELNPAIMNVNRTASAYALLYLDGTTLKMDRGVYPPGGINENTGARNSGLGVGTTILAENVQSVQFSHTTKNAAGDGNGCVKMNLTLRDPIDRDVLTVETATLMRNVWP